MSPEIKLLNELLKKHNFFVTKPRLQLFMGLQKHNTLTVHELITLLKHQDQATVYRNINLFEKLGIISRLQLGWHSRLELSDIFQHHHHHMTCSSCGIVIVLRDNSVIETEITSMSQNSGFKPTDHQLEIRGQCKNCQLPEKS